MQRLFLQILQVAMLGGALSLAGCAWHHDHKPKSFDKEFTDPDKDPTFRADAQRADVEEVHD